MNDGRSEGKMKGMREGKMKVMREGKKKGKKERKRRDGKINSKIVVENRREVRSYGTSKSNSKYRRNK